MLKKNNITIVTCFYIIKSKFSAEKYLQWIRNFVFFNFKVVIFCDNQSKQFITNNIPDTKSNEKIIFKLLNIADFETSKYNWNNDLSLDPEISIGTNHSIDLYKIWNEKIYFLH